MSSTLARTRVGQWVSITLFLILTVSSAQALAKEVIATDKKNTSWKVTSQAAQFVGKETPKRGPTIVFNKTLLLYQPQIITLTTDAKEINLRSGYRRVTLKLQGQGPHTLILDAKKPAITLNGKTDEKTERYWARLLEKSDKPTLEINFEDATKAKLAWKNKSAVTSAQTDQSGQSSNSKKVGTGYAGSTGFIPPGMKLPGIDPNNPSKAQTAITASHDALGIINRAKSAVFPVQIKLKDQPLQRTGIGTIVQGNFVILPLHLLRQASEANLIINGKSVSLSLVKIDVSHNLALLRLDMSSGAWRPIVKPFELADKEPESNEALYQIGLSPKKQITAVAQAVDDVGTLAELSKQWRAVIIAPPDSKWITLDDATIIGTGGGPLVNLKGQLVGLSTWFLPQRNTAGIAMEASQLKQFLADVPISGMLFESLNVTLADAKLPTTTFPKWQVTTHAPLQALQRATVTIKSYYKCPLCLGKGEAHRSKLRGYERSGGMIKPIVGTELYECPRCDSSKYNKIADFWNHLDKIAQPLALIDSKESNHNRVIEFTQKTLTEIASLDPTHLRQLLSKQSAKLFKEKKIVVGSSVFFVGRPQETELSKQSEHIYMIELTMPKTDSRSSSRSSSQNQSLFEKRNEFVLISSPVILPQSRASVVFVGGLLAGYVDIDTKKKIPVIQGGFIIEAKERPKEEKKKERPDRRRTTTDRRDSDRDKIRDGVRRIDGTMKRR